MEVINIQYNGIGKQSQTYSVVDTTLITDNFINSIFGDTNDYIEFFITDESGQILDYLYDSKNYTLTSEIGSGANQYSSILIDPEKDVKSRGFDRGRTIVQYNFFKRLFNSNLSNKYWIKEISTSRLELKLSSQTISGDSMNSGFNQFQSYIAQKNYYGDFYLNFGNNNLVIAVNAAYVNDNGESYILIKLYEQLPLDFDLKSELWIVDKLAESTSFLVDIQVESEVVIEEFKLRGPNYSVQTSDKAGQTTPYYSYQSLFSSPISSSTQQLLSYYDDKAISINVNYASFDNFIHFSSAAERINNFAYKVGLIETYNTQIAAQSSIIGNQSITSASIQTIKSNINNIIEKFDGYEYYLYYTSGAFAWPKSTKTTPYSLYSVTSSQALSWLGSENTLPTATSLSILYSASLYDNTNKDILRTSVPQYLLDDPSNQPYVTFMDMIGQHFDNIWIYYKDVTNRFNATNNPDTGISLDLVADAIRSLGIQLYTNTNLSDNVFYSLFGYNQDGSLLPPTGSEGSAAYPIRYVTSSISGSGVAYTLPYDQIQKEIYKRIYHNLPYLLKTRGTERGVKALIACYGIPDSILTINEFGGYDRYSQIGIEEIYNNKITVISGSNELSESLLSRYSTLQRYDRDNRKNSLNIEVGFSPANTINQNISASLGYFAIDNLIGNPRDQYSSSYQSLISASNSYFSTYTKPHSIWEYIRLIKFYNNSLFKMIKDFAPARSSVSSGIIIKPHVLERSKYKRNEPQPIFQNNYSESIDMVSISGSHATSYAIDTTTYESAPSLIGYIPITSSFGFEKYTGEFQGTDLIVTDLNSLGDQSEYSNNATTQSLVNRGALFQNISKAVRSQKYLDLDYGYDANVPVNFGIITQSIDNSQIDNYSTYTNKDNPYAELQDYNYFAQRSTIPRYYGSKLTSLKYNVYTTSSVTWQGDTSYGNNPVINRNSIKIGWVKNIPSQSLNFPDKTTINLKYLVDKDSNLLELSYANQNLFEVQNTFKSGTPVIVSLSDVRKPSNQVTLDGTKTIFRGGYLYDPIIFRENNEPLKFKFDIPYSSSTFFPGLTVTDPTIHSYIQISGTANTGPTNINNGLYKYTIQNSDLPGVYVEQSNKAMAYARYGANYRYSSTTFNSIGYDYSLTPSNLSNLYLFNSTTNYEPTCYSFNLFKFNKVISNTDPSPDAYNDNGQYTYKVTRTSTYQLKGNIPFYFQAQNFKGDGNALSFATPGGSGISFKVVGIVEKNINPNADDNTWQYVASTQLSPYNQTNITSVNQNYNGIIVKNSTQISELGADLLLNVNSVQLNSGDYIRFRFHLIDFTGIFNRLYVNYNQFFSFRIGNISARYQEQCNFSITDTLTSITEYFDTKYYGSINPFFKADSSSSIIFDALSSDFFTSASTFQPSETTQQYYTPIVDNLSIQPYDLLRIGSFNSAIVNYYEIANVSSTQRTAVTLPTGNFNAGSTFVGPFYLCTTNTAADSAYTASLFNIGDTVSISNTSLNNVTAYINYISFFGNLLLFGFRGNIVNETATPTFFPTNSQKRAILANNILDVGSFNSSSQNFAILRPKQNETSVIIDYKKIPGEVSQTVLIPYDASDEIKNSVGNIYKTINPDIS